MTSVAHIQVLEPARLMTALASHAETTTMGVISGVASVTAGGGIQLLVIISRRSMTATAADILVPALQRIIGLGVVIELPARPAVGVMTGRAILAQGTLMCVDLTVTGQTVLWR